MVNYKYIKFFVLVWAFMQVFSKTLEAGGQAAFEAENPEKLFEGVEFNSYQKKFAYLTVIATQKQNPVDLYDLAQMYKEGECVKKDSKKFLHYLKRSARAGSSMALAELGSHYLDKELNIAKCRRYEECIKTSLLSEKFPMFLISFRYRIYGERCLKYKLEHPDI